jgi:soluble lytic murein transglycosylase
MLLAGATLFGQGRNPALSSLAAGITAYERKDYATAIGSLKGLSGRLPKLADYAGYYLAAAEVESKMRTDVAADVATVWAAPVTSPLVAKAAIIAASGLLTAGKANDAIQVLKQHYDALAQPDGDLALAAAYEGAGDLAHAAIFYQQVYHRYPENDLAARAATALSSLKGHMGASWQAPSPQMAFERAGRLMETRNKIRARVEYGAIVAQLSGLERDLARVRSASGDCQQLKSMQLADSEADAERLYYVAECAARQGDDGARMEAIRHLNQQHEHSPWRFKTLLSLASKYLVANRVDDYEPLFEAAGRSFPAEPRASGAHWRYVWAGYMRRKPDAEDRLREHLRLFGAQPTAGSALYFLGRLAEEGKDYGAAHAYFGKLADQFPNYYYGILGRKKLGDGAIAAATPSTKVQEFLMSVPFAESRYPGKQAPTLETQTRIERAQLLRSAGLTDLADAELRFGARNGGQPALLAIEVARAAESSFLGLRAMKSLVPEGLTMPLDTAPKDFWQFLFPLPYKDELLTYAKTHSLDPCMVAALIRQESEFNPRALSPAKAYGLTQVMPVTGRSLARKAGLRTFSSSMLYQPGTNLRLGTLYMRMLLDQLNGNWEEMLAAYNAGKGRVTLWQSWATYREPAEFVESIPFTETREYVQGVLRNAEIYRRVYGSSIQAKVSAR